MKQSDNPDQANTTHFGFETVEVEQKARRVADVFSSVASHYDIMNDVMSLGLHRYWKRTLIELIALNGHEKVLDIAGGTGDLPSRMASYMQPEGEVWLSDINYEMLHRGRDRLLNEGCIFPVAQMDAEHLPFSEGYFDVVTLAFGLRNMTNKAAALAEILRVLKPGGRVYILEFSQAAKPIRPLYDLYSFKWLPWLGEKIAGDAASYRYLAESIRMHPDQTQLSTLIEAAGFDHVRFINFNAGIVALHSAYKP